MTRKAPRPAPRKAPAPAPRTVTVEQARRIAVRAQLLDGSAKGILPTVRRLGFLQLDPIASVATPQHLVLWSRLGPFDTADLDNLLWTKRKLFEWDAFIYPIESFPLIHARMRKNRRATKNSWDRRRQQFLKDNAGFRRYVLRELERKGPLLSRELEDRSGSERRDHRWYGNRLVGPMLATLHIHGDIAIVGRRGGQKLWDLAERWYPETEPIAAAEAERILQEQRFRALGVRFENGEWRAHPQARDGAVPDRVTFLSPFDRLIHDRARAEALFDFHYRLEMYVPSAKREYGYYVLPILVGDRLVGRIEPRFDRRNRTLEVLGSWGDTARIDEGLESLAHFLGAELKVQRKRTSKRRPAR
ncbi:MAG: winged helix DNA-binding domain-containing protein [Actinomycetota bacterium]|nr:winged helix DNA-binding domain-containing protein [Actinomycetota bacterium]